MYVLKYLPINTPIDIRIIKGRLRPRFEVHLSLSEPRSGVRKNPISGDSAQTSVIRMCSTPIFSNVGDTNAVSAAYENSIPATAADILISSHRDFFLQISITHLFHPKYVNIAKDYVVTD